MSPFLHREAVDKADALSMAEGLRQLELPEDEHDIVAAALTVGFSAPLNDVAYTQGLRRMALAGGHSIIGDIVRYRVVGGLQGVVESILADSDAEVRLGAAVQCVEQSPDDVRVTTRDGVEWRATRAIVTVPANVLPTIEFSPPLCGARAGLAAERQATRGCMFWVMLEGSYEPFMALASDEHPLSFMKVDGEVDGGTVAQVLGPDAQRLDLTDVDQVQAAVRQWVPDAVVGGTLGHNWVSDEFSLQTWAIARPGQMAKYHSGLMAPDGSVSFAGADYAGGWYGYVDGAIESGLAVARQIRSALR